MEIALTPDVVIHQLWAAYRKTPEFRQGAKYAIPANHRLVFDQERDGLKAIYIKFVISLKGDTSIKIILKNRSLTDWLKEWQEMHNILYKHILKECGKWRKTEVRFGDAGDEELYKIPPSHMVLQSMGNLAKMLMEFLQEEDPDENEKYYILARMHYEFIRIHPFFDGNGRIARALTDQLAMFFNFPVAMGGYPRHNAKSRAAYHHAIKSCINDPECRELALWIKSYIDRQIQAIA